MRHIRFNPHQPVKAGASSHKRLRPSLVHVVSILTSPLRLVLLRLGSRWPCGQDRFNPHQPVKAGASP